MSLVAPRVLQWNTTDLSQATATSEIVDMRDIRQYYGVMITTGAPTGTFQVWLYYGHPVKTSAGLDWSSNDYNSGGTFSASGTPNRYGISLGSGASAFQIVYTRSSGAGSVRVSVQAKESRTI